MFDLDHWQEIWDALRKNKLRTFLTAFGVFWGIFLLVLLLGSGNGLSNGVNAGFSGTATNSLFVWGQRSSKPYKGLAAGRAIEFSNEDTAALRRDVTEARLVAPRLQLGGFRGGNTVTRGGNTGAFSVMGDLPEIVQIQSLKVINGRFLDHIDLEEHRKVAVIGKRVQEILFDKGEDPIGGSIKINGVYFKVIGVFASRQSGNQAERDLQTIYTPFTTAQQAFNQNNKVHWYAITSKDGVPASKAEEHALAILRERHTVAPDDNRAIGHFNLEEEFGKIQALFGGIRALMWIVGIGTLAAGAIGVSNILLIIVRERTKEIGIRRAVGATPWAIMGQILLEALVLTSVAGLLGLCAGVGVLEAVSLVMAKAGGAGGSQPSMFQNPGVSLANAVQALAILVGVGALAGSFPAQRAVAVTPVVALRSE